MAADTYQLLTLPAGNGSPGLTAAAAAATASNRYTAIDDGAPPAAADTDSDGLRG